MSETSVIQVHLGRDYVVKVWYFNNILGARNFGLRWLNTMLITKRKMPDSNFCEKSKNVKNLFYPWSAAVNEIP